MLPYIQKTRWAICWALVWTTFSPSISHAQEALPEMRALKPQAETYPNLSSDGRYVVYSAGQGFALNLYRLDLTTNHVLQLTDNAFEDSAPAWAPDGQTIIFQREDEEGNRDIWQINATGGAVRNLTNTPAIREQHPRYAPDGTAIVFDSNRLEAAEDGGSDGIQNYEIYWMSLLSDSLARLTTWSRWDMYPSLSPSGEHLVWRRALRTDEDDGQNFDIFVKDMRTGMETNVTQHSAFDTNPHWSPSGDWIVFASNRNGSFDLYVIRPDGSELRPITNSGSRSLGYSRPSFSGDGTQVIANRSVRGVTDMVVIDFQDRTDARERNGC